MADHSISISNTINCFESPSSLWGFMVWGTDTWGDGSQDLYTSTGKLIEDSQDSNSSVLNSAGHIIDSQEIVPESDITEIIVSSGSWDYVFPLPTTNSDIAAHTTYTPISNNAVSWSCATVGSTLWS